MECQNLLRQLKEEEEEAAAAAEEAEAEEEVEEEEEEEEEEELKSSASSSARGRRLTAQRTCSTERRLAVVAKLTLCPLSRVSSSPCAMCALRCQGLAGFARPALALAPLLPHLPARHPV